MSSECKCPYLPLLRAKIAAGHADDCNCPLCTKVRGMELRDLHFFEGGDDDGEEDDDNYTDMKAEARRVGAEMRRAIRR